MPATPIDTYVFDCGGVITFDQDATAVAHMATKLGAELEAFRHIYAEERREYDRGSLSAAEYWDRVAARAGATVDARMLSRLIELDLASWFNINPAVVDIVSGLRPHARRLLVLSNMNLEGKRRVFGSARYCGSVDWTALFDRFLFSCDLRMVKPEPEIYETCIEAAETDPARCLLIDDTEANVDAARNAGMRAIRYTGAPELAEALARGLAGGDHP